MEKGKNFCVCFINLLKAFNCVRWEKLTEVLERKGVNWRERRLIGNLYMKQKANIRFGNGKTEWFSVGRGVRQGCCLSPALFNIYMEDMVGKRWENEKGISIGGRNIVSRDAFIRRE